MWRLRFSSTGWQASTVYSWWPDKYGVTIVTMVIGAIAVPFGLAIASCKQFIAASMSWALCEPQVVNVAVLRRGAAGLRLAACADRVPAATLARARGALRCPPEDAETENRTPPLREWTPVKTKRYFPLILFFDFSCCSAVVLVTWRPLQLRQIDAIQQHRQLAGP